jgi:serine/threonine-protein kinase
VVDKKDAVLEFPYALTADGSQMLIGSIHRETDLDVPLATLGVGETESRPLVGTPYLEFNGTLSPDDRWVAYSSEESGRRQVYVRPFPDLDGKWQISADGGDLPVWDPDGDELFYVSGSNLGGLFGGGGTMMRVPFSATDRTFSPGVPEVLFEGDYVFTGGTGRVYDISADGQQFLVQKAPGAGAGQDAGARIVIVENWFEELKRLVPAD